MKNKIKSMLTRDNLTAYTDKIFSPPQRLALINSIFVFVVIGFIAGTFLKGCGKTSDQKIKNANETVELAKQDLNNARTEYLAEMQTFKLESEKTIEANGKRIDAFKEKMEKAGHKDIKKYNKEVAVLGQKNRELKKKLEEYKDDGQDKWKEFKTNFNQDLDGIGKTMKDLFKDNS